jgi:hypothetical protein
VQLYMIYSMRIFNFDETRRRCMHVNIDTAVLYDKYLFIVTIYNLFLKRRRKVCM